MKLSNNGLDFIKNYEGLRLKAYKVLESEKYYTIGYGHFGADVRFGDEITKKEATDLFKKDVDRFEKGVEKYVKVDVNQNQFDALVSLAYNIGLGAFQTSTLLEKVNKKDFEGASEEFDRWIRSGGKILAGLVKRRAKEKELFLKPVDKPKQAAPKKEEVKKKTYTVKNGDNLTKIAKNHDLTLAALKKLNPQIKDANLIHPGDKIKLN